MQGSSPNCRDQLVRPVTESAAMISQTIATGPLLSTTTAVANWIIRCCTVPAQEPFGFSKSSEGSRRKFRPDIFRRTTRVREVDLADFNPEINTNRLDSSAAKIRL